VQRKLHQFDRFKDSVKHEGASRSFTRGEISLVSDESAAKPVTGKELKEA
jgi:hypothetical protein